MDRPSRRGPRPTKWDATKNENILWKTPIPGLAHSSPVVLGRGRCFITTAIRATPRRFSGTGFMAMSSRPKTSPNTPGRSIAWTATTGKFCVGNRCRMKVRRKRSGIRNRARPRHHPPQTASTWWRSSARGSLYLRYERETALKQDLGILNAGWFYDPDYEWTTASSPVIYKNLVIVQCDIAKNSFIAAFDLDTGKTGLENALARKFPRGALRRFMKARERAELVTNSTKSIHGYDPRDRQGNRGPFKIKNSESDARRRRLWRRI